MISPSAINAAISGYTAATQRIGAAANNIANADSTQTFENNLTVNKPYVPVQVNQSSQTTGGVTTQIAPVNPPSIGIGGTQDVAQGANGITQFPNVDVAQQLVNVQAASYTAQANLNVLKVEGNLFKSVLNIIA